jgi:hypothetical protein
MSVCWKCPFGYPRRGCTHEGNVINALGEVIYDFFVIVHISIVIIP